MQEYCDQGDDGDGDGAQDANHYFSGQL